MKQICAIVSFIVLFTLKVQAQSISYFSPQSVCLGATQRSSVSFNGTFGSDNKFTIQVRPYYQSNIVAEIPATLVNGMIEAVYTDSSLSTYYNLEARLVSSSPRSESSWYSFSVYSKGFVNLSSVLSDTINAGDNLELLFSGQSSTYVNITLSDSTRYSFYSYSGNSISQTYSLPVFESKTIFIVRASNQCGAMKVGGQVKSTINPISLRTSSIFPYAACEGSEIKIGFSTLEGTLPAQATYKIRLREVSNSSGNAAGKSTEISAVLRDNFLVARIPSSLNISPNNRTNFKVQVIVDNPKIVGNPGDAMLSVYPKPTATFTTSSKTLNIGEEMSLGIRFDGMPPFSADLGNGTVISSNYYGDQTTYVRPTKTTSYILKEFSTGCGTATLSSPQTLVATVRPGVMLIPEGNPQILCTDTKSRVRFTSTDDVSDATSYAMNVQLYSDKVYSFPAVRNGDYLEFTIPSLPSGTAQEFTYDNSSNFYITTNNPSVQSPRLYNSNFTINSKPSMSVSSPSSLVFSTPGYTYLNFKVYGGGPFTIEDQQGRIFTGNYGYWNPNFFLEKTTEYRIKSISNACYKTDNPISTTLTLNATSSTGIYLVPAKTALCSTDSAEVTLLTTGVFGEGNVFTIQGRSGGNYETLKTVTGPGTYKVKIPLTTYPSSQMDLRVSSSNPVHISEQYVRLHYPIPSFAFSYPGTPEQPNRYTGPLSNFYLQFNSASNAITSLVYSDGVEDKTVTLSDYSSSFPVNPPVGKTTVYTVKSVTNSCGTTEVNASTYIQVLPYSVELSGEFESASFCTGNQIFVPFAIYNGSAGNATFSLQLALQNSETFTSIATGETSRRFTTQLPASIQPGYYKIRVVSSDGAISSPRYIKIGAAPTARLSSEFPSPVTIEANNSANLKIDLTGSEPWTIIDQINNKYGTNYNPYSYWINPAKGLDYALKSVYNSCGYGTVSGTVKIIVKPSLRMETSQYSICEGEKFTFSYELRGDATLTNDYIRFELLETNSGRRITLDSTRTFSGVKTITIPSGLPNGYYQIQGSVRSYNLNYSMSVSVTTKSNIRISGSTIINSGESALLYLTNQGSQYGQTSYVLSDGTSGTIYGGYGSETTLRVSPSQTTTYTLTSVTNSCGPGKISGSATIEVNPPSERTISTSQVTSRNGGSLCLGDTLQVYYTTKGVFDNGNTMTVQISDTTGRNFRNITTIGNSSPLGAVLPTDLINGKKYNIRVTASTPNTASGAYQYAMTARQKAKARFASDVILFNENALPKVVVLLEGGGPWNYSFFSDSRSYNKVAYTSSDTTVLNQASPNQYYRLSNVYNQCGIGTIENPSLLKVELVTGIAEEVSAISMGPNPTSDFVFIKFNTQQEREISLYSSQGIMVRSKSTRLSEEKIDLQNLSSGIYILRIESKGKMVTFKIVKN